MAACGQDQEANVVSKEVEATPAQLGAPADPGIARSALQGCHTPAQERYPLLLEEGDVAKGGSESRAQAQVMVGPHQVSPARAFLAAHGTHDDLVQGKSTAIGCLVHGGKTTKSAEKLPAPSRDSLRCYISNTLTEPWRLGGIPRPSPGLPRGGPA